MRQFVPVLDSTHDGNMICFTCLHKVTFILYYFKMIALLFDKSNSPLALSGSSQWTFLRDEPPCQQPRGNEMMPSDKPASAHEASSSGQRNDGSLWRVSLPIKRKEKKKSGESRAFVTEGRALSDGWRGEIRREAERTRTRARARASHSEAGRGPLRDTRHVAADGGGGSSV